MMRTLLILIAFVVATGPALAQPQASDADKKKAQEHYERALAHQKLGEHAEAAAEFERAHGLFPDPEFHYLIGEALERAGDLEGALARYQRYLAEDPNGRAVAMARAAVERVEPQVEQARAEAEARARAEAEARERAQAAAEPKPEPVTAEPPARDDGIARPGRGLRIAGVASGGVGLVLLGLGVKFALDARSAEADVEEQFDPDRVADGEAAERNMFISYGLGAAALGAGVTLYLMGRRAAAEQPAVSAVPIAGGAMALLRGRF